MCVCVCVCALLFYSLHIFSTRSNGGFSLKSECQLRSPELYWVHLAITLFFSLLHYHHHIVLVARISLTLSRHSSLSFIALGRSLRQHPVSSHSC